MKSSYGNFQENRFSFSGFTQIQILVSLNVHQAAFLKYNKTFYKKWHAFHGCYRVETYVKLWTAFLRTEDSVKTMYETVVVVVEFKTVE